MSKAERRIILACLTSFISGAALWHFYYTGTEKPDTAARSSWHIYR